MEHSDDIITAYDGGLTIEDIATELGMSQAAVRSFLEEQGRITDPSVTEIIEEYRNDVPAIEIITKRGLTYAKLYNILSSQGEPIRKRRPQGSSTRSRMMDEAVQMYVDGALLKEIKAETGVAQPALHSELYRRKIKLRRPRS